MDERDRVTLRKRLNKTLKIIYLTSLGTAHIYIGHARRTRDQNTREKLITFAAEERERRDEAARLMALQGRGKPWQRPLWHVIGWSWGRLTAFGGPDFSMHMMSNVEHEAQKITAMADKLAHELGDLPVVEALVRLGRAGTARKEWLVERLRALVGA